MLTHIQILRFLAAAAVVAFHAWTVMPEFTALPRQANSFWLAHAGHGVDLFFVISGFIIFYATARATMTPGVFLRRRIERIVPLYFFVTFVVIGLALAWPEIFDTPGWLTARHIVKSLSFVSFSDGEMPVVYLGWSLEYEMFFYVSVAAIMALTVRTWRSVLIGFSALVMVGRIPGVAGALGNYSFFTDSMLLEFAIGVLIGWAFVRSRVRWGEAAVLSCAFALVAWLDPFDRAILFGLPSALLVLAAAHLSRLRSTPVMVETVLERLGDASYSIYLAQVQTVWFLTKYSVLWLPGLPFMLSIAFVTVGVIAIGFLLNVAVERPMLSIVRRVQWPRPPIRAASAGETP
jgi:exopolysaccharide production protein ExoZ